LSAGAGTAGTGSFVARVLGDASLPGHGMQRVDHVEHLQRLLLEVLGAEVPGEVVELGCNAGLTAVLLQEALDGAGSDKRLHVFDSFEGLPALSAKDGAAPYSKGSCTAPPEMLLENFRRFGKRLPVIHPGWFDRTLPRELPPSIAFAHFDADLYDSTLVALREVYPRLSRGGVAVLHDFYDATTREGVPPGVRVEDHVQLPGVPRACAEFFEGKPERVKVLLTDGLQCGQGYFRKLG
jgi:O-methyltransferase